MFSTFDRRGDYVYSGNTKGRIQVLRLEPDSIDFTIITTFRVSNTAIKQIEFAPKQKNLFLVNSADRIIRVYNTEDVLALANQSNASSTAANSKSRKSVQANSSNLGSDSKTEPVLLEPTSRIQDLVSRTTWKKCVFSAGPQPDYICAASSRQHSLYMWDRNAGAHLTFLNGTKGEIVSDVIWHPISPQIISIANGIVSIWSLPQVENWSAFAPDFKEIEENVEYEERESEFDEFDEDRTPTRLDPNASDEEDAEVDVMTPYAIDIFLSRYHI